MIKVLKDNDFDSLINNKKVLVDFYATWCNPCMMLSKVLDTIEDIDIIKVNVDEYRDLAKKYAVMTLPTLIIFENGKEIKKHIGLLSKSELKEFIS